MGVVIRFANRIANRLALRLATRLFVFVAHQQVGVNGCGYSFRKSNSESISSAISYSIINRFISYFL